MPQPNAITTVDIETAQAAWGDAIVAIGQAFTDGKDYTAITEHYLETLYGYGVWDDILFKPTKAAQQPFRTTYKDALSYFVKGDISEDTGFAITPWTNVSFDNAVIHHGRDISLAMGHYTFTDTSGTPLKVEYTFGYRRDPKGNVRIILQHSSVPFAV